MRISMETRRRFSIWAGVLLLALACAEPPLRAADNKPNSVPGTSTTEGVPLTALGPGDTLSISVFEQPDMNATVGVADDGTVSVALVGSVPVVGLSPEAAARAIEKRLRDGNFLVNPHVTIGVTQSHSQKISVLGEVGQAGRYVIDSHTSILDVLAQAGGAKESAANVVYIVRSDADGNTVRIPVDISGKAGSDAMAGTRLRGGDTLLVPKADRFFVYGEVAKAGEYSLDHEMTVLQAIVEAGGVTPRGSIGRVEVRRKAADGKQLVVRSRLDDRVQPGDEIRVKERIF